MRKARRKAKEKEVAMQKKIAIQKNEWREVSFHAEALSDALD